jgi:hypothetical protein
MENKDFTPEESLALIAKVISEAKSRLRDNGFSFIFLGICSFASSFGQFILLKLGYYQINYYPYFIMPIAAGITFFYYKKKKHDTGSSNIIGLLLTVLGLILAFNTMVAGFFFWEKFGVALVPFILILFSIWSVLTGILTKNKIFVISGIVINVIAYITFFISWNYHPLVMSVVSLIGIVVPGILLYYSRKESHV